VSIIISNFLDLGIVHEIGRGESTGGRRGGRRPIIVRFNPASRTAVGLELDADGWTAVLVDLDSKPLKRLKGKVFDTAPESVATLIEEIISRLISDREPGTVIGYGIGLPGLLDLDHGIVRFAANLGWRDVPLQSLLEHRLGGPVKIANRVKLAALGEWQHRANDSVDDLVYISVGTGIGASMVIGRSLQSGVSDSAGEIGHITVDPNGALCSCGNRGCLETVAAWPAIISRLRQQIEAGAQSILGEWVDDLADLTMAMVIVAFIERDPLTVEVIRQAGRYLGIAIATMVNLLNPRLVIVGGPLALTGDLFLHSIIETVQQRALPVSVAAVDILLSELGRDAVPIGAAALVLEEQVAIASLVTS
jgi:N-acetylglucosamine repressor